MTYNLRLVKELQRASLKISNPDTGLGFVAAAMFTTSKKISKDKGVEPTEFEDSVAQALFDQENSNSDLKTKLKDLYINSAAQVDLSGNKKAVVVHVPYRLRKAYRNIHVRLVRELEKNFSGKSLDQIEVTGQSKI